MVFSKSWEKAQVAEAQTDSDLIFCVYHILTAKYMIKAWIFDGLQSNRTPPGRPACNPINPKKTLKREGRGPQADKYLPQSPFRGQFF
jgi:hypothetical protein